MTVDNERKCSICGDEYYGYGHNPAPVTLGEGDRCCDACNATTVIPVRFAMMEKPEVLN